jgi:UDP-N-acetylmuramate--alanine ligase
MSAIARVLLQQGYTVSGSDQRPNDLTRTLEAEGLAFHADHAAENIAGADLLLISSAVPDTNSEVCAAREQSIPVMHRREMLGELMAGQTGIAIAGTHGKTTTTALMAHTLIAAGLDPTYIIGGVMQNTHTNAGVGQGGYFVIEADEYDYMFLGLSPTIAVVTNIEHDHPDCFPTRADVIHAFEEFAALLPPDGLLVACADDPGARALAEKRRAAGYPVLVYGLGEGIWPYAPTWNAADLEPDPAGGVLFTARRGDCAVGRMRLGLAGQYNVQNALAVLAVADHLGVPFEQIAAAFDSFRGTERRSEILGRAGGVTVISDYAHHPTAIRVTLEALRTRLGLWNLWAVWQPHTFGRIRTLADEFAESFDAADHVLVTDVYSVRENAGPGLDAPDMVEKIRAAGQKDARYTGSLDATAHMLIEQVRSGDLVVILSAGDAPRIGEQVLAALRQMA